MHKREEEGAIGVVLCENLFYASVALGVRAEIAYYSRSATESSWVVRSVTQLTMELIEV